MRFVEIRLDIFRAIRCRPQVGANLLRLKIVRRMRRTLFGVAKRKYFMFNRNKTLLWIVILCVLGLLVFLIVSRPVSHQKRLFSEWRETDYGRRALYQTRPVYDKYGNWVFLDRDLNYLLIIVTNDPTRRSWYNELDANEGIMFKGAPSEIRVVGKRNVLEVAVSAVHRELFEITYGEASVIYRNLRSIEPVYWIYDELLQSYRGPNEIQMRHLVERMRARQIDQQTTSGSANPDS